MRSSIDINTDWVFKRGRASVRWLNGSGTGERVDLPHCWNADDAFLDKVEYYRGPGSYRWAGAIETPVDDGRWFIESDGFYGTGKLYVNGRYVSRFDGQYLGLRQDVTPFLSEGNIRQIGITMTNRCASYVLPGISMPDFLLYGGLSGAMRLVRRPSLYFDERLLAVRCENGDGESATVRVEFGLLNSRDHEVPVETVWRIHDPDGHPVGTETRCRVVAGAGSATMGSVLIPAAGLKKWSIEAPVLYEVRGGLPDGEHTVDRVKTRFGLRQAEFRSGAGFFLNGQRVPLRGCNRHESMPGFGRALPERQHREDAMLLKDMGMNFVRLSHYPEHPVFLDACDELGILVFAEIASWKSVRRGRWLKRALRQMRDMILRDRNHPSIILWGMGNESRSRVAYRKMRALAGTLDSGRPVCYAENHLYRAKRQSTLDLCDVWGSNYELDVLDEVAGYARTGNVIVTECSNIPYAERGHPAGERDQVERIQADLERFAGNPCVAGYALWCFNDYSTYRKKRYRRYSGVVDAWRLPKASALHLREKNGVSGNPHCPELWEAVAPGEGQRACRLEVRPESRGALAAESTRAVLVLALDAEGRKDGHWSGDIHLSIDGPARLHTLGGNGTVWVRAGVGRCFITGTGGEGPVRIRAEHSSLMPAELSMADGAR